MSEELKPIGLDCEKQGIIPLSESVKISVHTNRHPNTNGTAWGWVNGCTKNIVWSDDHSFDYIKAAELAYGWNNRSTPEESQDERIREEFEEFLKTKHDSQWINFQWNEIHGYRDIYTERWFQMFKAGYKSRDEELKALQCCANCGQFECPHRDIHSKTPCVDEDDTWGWEGV